MKFPPLIDSPTLADHIDDPALRVFDATVRLVRPRAGGPYSVESGRSGYEEQHIPGAAFADIPGQLSDPESTLPLTLPPPEQFARAAASLGIGRGTHVVVYAQETPMWATRLWWQLRFFGFEDVSVLDGGLPGWRAAGLPVSDSTATYPPGHFVADPQTDWLATRADVEAVADGGGSACLLNALTPPVFRGEGPSSYSRAGRIPGSVNASWTELIDPDTHRFRPVAELRATLAAAGALGPRPVIAYCGAGIAATVDLFGLFLTGRADARLYDGSLSEWTREPHLPVEVG